MKDIEIQRLVADFVMPMDRLIMHEDSHPLPC